MNILDREELSDEMENKNIQCRKSSNFIEKSQKETKSIHLTHKYISTHFRQLVQAIMGQTPS